MENSWKAVSGGDGEMGSGEWGRWEDGKMGSREEVNREWGRW